VIFESQPNYYVTANLYIPKGRKFPLPGVVFTCGHIDDGKAASEYGYQMTCIGLALKGYVVLIFDPMGQGERSEYFETETKKPLVDMSVSQHHYVGRPAFLVDWTLSGLRTWDAIRAVDYLESRPEVDKNKLASVGQSGGGQMALLITAVDERIKVCAASHPGGSMENTYLLGQSLIDREILSLIPPRPLRIIVGKDSGEEPNHRGKLEDMQLFYEGLRAGKQCGDLDVVPGIHSMNRSNRESAYEWLNKWLDKEAEGKAEAMLEPEKIETLWCTKSGNTIGSLGGETGQTLNAKRAEQIYKPEMNLTKLKD
jgi:dienelactone hydrolase